MPTETAVLAPNQVIYIGAVPVWELNGSGQVTLARNGLASRATRKFAYYDVNFNALCNAIANGGVITAGAVQVQQSIFFPPVPGLVFRSITFHKGDPSSIYGLSNNIVNGCNSLGYMMRYFDIEYGPLDYSELNDTVQVEVESGDFLLPVSRGMIFVTPAGGTDTTNTPPNQNLLVPWAKITASLKNVPFIPFGWLQTYNNVISSTNMFGFAPIPIGNSGGTVYATVSNFKVAPPYSGFGSGGSNPPPAGYGGTVMFKGFTQTGPRQVFIANNVSLGPLTAIFNWDIELHFEWLACGWNFQFNPFGSPPTFELVTTPFAPYLPQFTYADLTNLLQQPDVSQQWTYPTPKTLPNQPISQ